MMIRKKKLSLDIFKISKISVNCQFDSSIKIKTNIEHFLSKNNFNKHTLLLFKKNLKPV